MKDLVQKSSVEGGKFQCFLCKQELGSSTAINYHIKNLHILKKNKQEPKPPRVKKRKQENKDLAIFSGLSEEQVDQLKDLVKKSSLEGGKFQCFLCVQQLHSRSAINYHIKHRHILKELKEETKWVSQRVKEGKQAVNEGGIIKIEWHCSMCEKKYPSHQGMRAHVKTHYSENSNMKEPDQDTIGMIVSSLGDY